jgi:hypothetical protein
MNNKRKMKKKKKRTNLKGNTHAQEKKNKINRRNQSNNSGAVKRICKNSLTPSKGKT